MACASSSRRRKNAAPAIFFVSLWSVAVAAQANRAISRRICCSARSSGGGRYLHTGTLGRGGDARAIQEGEGEPHVQQDRAGKRGYRRRRQRGNRLLLVDHAPYNASIMVRLNRIYTKAGDGGATRLVGGQKVPKDSLRIQAYGTVDELMSCLGLVRTALSEPDAPQGAAALEDGGPPHPERALQPGQ